MNTQACPNTNIQSPGFERCGIDGINGIDAIREILYALHIAEQRRAIVEEFRASCAREFFVDEACAGAEEPCSSNMRYFELSTMYAAFGLTPDRLDTCRHCQDAGIPAILSGRGHCLNCGIGPWPVMPPAFAFDGQPARALGRSPGESKTSFPAPDFRHLPSPACGSPALGP